MKPNHSQTIRTLVSPTHNHHRTRNTSKSNQFDLLRLTGVHHRQTVQPNTQNPVLLPCVAWRPGMCRKAVPLQEPKNQYKNEVLLGGDSSPARRFMEKFKKHENHLK